MNKMNMNKRISEYKEEKEMIIRIEKKKILE